MGVSDDEPNMRFAAADKDMMLTITGVDLTTLVRRGKFVFLAQIGSPQKAVKELRDQRAPYGIGMDVLITGLSTKACADLHKCNESINQEVLY